MKKGKVKPFVQNSTTQNQTVNKLKQSLYELALTTTVHALPKIVTTQLKLVRIIWTFFLIVSTSFGVYFVYKSVIEYLHYDAVTLYEIIQEQNSYFPTVSFCNLNRFKENALNQNIRYCYFNGDDSCFKTKEYYFESFDDIAYGKCFRFNSGKPIGLFKSYLSGLRYGLFLEFVNLSPTDRLIINIHNNSLKPNTMFNKETFISIGSVSEFSVSRTYIQYLPEPYNNCYKDVRTYPFNKTFINKILNDNKTYSQKECIDKCSFQYYLDNSNCGCNSPAENVEILCFLFAKEPVKNCTLKFVSNFLKNGKHYELCLEYCPLECDSFIYHINKYSSLSNNNETIIYVYYDELKYMLIGQQPKILLVDLVPNIGGILGLFVGTSFLSFIEIIELIIELIYILLKK